MHYFIAEITQQEVGNVKSFLRQAQAIYDENLNAYIKLVLRRPLAKILVSDSPMRTNQPPHLVSSLRISLMASSESCKRQVHQKFPTIAVTTSRLSSAL